VIKARTDSMEQFGFDAAIERANRYAEAGADLLFADALRTPEQMEEFISRVDAPVSINMGFGLRSRSTTPLLGYEDLEDMGAAVVELPRMLTSAAIMGMRTALETLKSSPRISAATERTDLLISFDELSTLMGLPEVLDLEEEFSS
jgi:2-methylisocitrate lyase-like PEP mutase family enzyme